MKPVALNWERHKETMRALYLDERKTLKDVMEIMKRPPYNFSATKKQYERQFQKKWHFRKNITQRDRRILHSKVLKRQLQGKRTKVFVDGYLQKTEKLEHEISRYGLGKSAAFECEPNTPEGMCLRSPTPETPISPCMEIDQAMEPMCDPEETSLVSVAATTGGIVEYQPIPAKYFMYGLPYCELFKLFDLGFQVPHDKLASLSSEYFASFIMLPHGPVWSGKGPIQEVVASKRASLLQAMLPSTADTLRICVGDTQDPLFRFLTNAAYLFYNGLGSRNLGAFMVEILNLPENRQVMERIMSSPSIAFEAIVEELFLSLLDGGKDREAAHLLEEGKVTPHALQLAEAARTGCLRTVELLLKGGIDPNSHPCSSRLSFDSNSTALELAVASGHNSVAKKLVDYGADPNELRNVQKPHKCAFVDAIQNGNVVLLDYFIQSPKCQASNHNVKPDHKALRLSVAAENGNIDMVNALLPYVDVNCHAPDGYSALAAAALAGKDDVVSFLLKSGASPNRSGRAARHNFGPSPLQAAIAATDDDDASMDDLGTIRLLVECGADLNEPPEDWDDSWACEWSNRFVPNRTAIQAAAERGHEKLFFYLLDRGANQNAPAAQRHGLTALQGAIKSKSKALCDFFFTSPIPFYSLPTSHAGTTDLIEAIRAQNMPAVRFFLQSGCNVNYTGTLTAGCTALSAAILTGEMALVQLLLSCGADINHLQVSHDGGTALHAAFAIDDFHLVKTLIARGADVFDERALWSAVTTGQIDIIITMLSKIKRSMIYNPNRRIRGQLALKAAIERGDVSIVLELLQCGVNPNEAATLDINEGDRCEDCSFLDVFGTCMGEDESCFDRRSTSGARALATAVMHQNKEMVELLLQNGADVEFRMDNYETNHVTLLGYAAGSGQSDIVEILLAHGADINPSAEGRFGRTPLQSATENGHFKIVQLLLNKGADCNAPPASFGGATALQLASMKGYLGIAQMLLDRGANPDASAAKHQGRTALEAAAEHGRIDMLRYLLNIGARTGGPESFKGILGLASQGGHMACVRLLKLHLVETLGLGLLDGIWSEEDINVMVA